MDWKSRMIWNCPAVDAEPQLGYRCGENWWALDPTPSPDVRHCRSCLRDVHLCHSVDELVTRGEAGECVAVPPEFVPIGLSRMWLGRPSPAAIASLHADRVALASWWAEAADRLPAAFGGDLDLVRTYTARVLAEPVPVPRPNSDIL